MRIILGLGNPGARYAERATTSTLLVDCLARQAGPNGLPVRDHSVLVKVDWDGQPVVGQAPNLYEWQRSCRARPVHALCRAAERRAGCLRRFLLDFGRLRLRGRGSDGGQRLASVIEELSSRRATSALGHRTSAAGW